MQIRVCSPLATFAYAMAAEFEARCGATVSVSTSDSEEQADASLCHRPGLSAKEVLRLTEVLHPIKVHVFEEPTLTGCDAQITVSWDKSLGETTAYLAAESPDMLADLRDLVGLQLGFEVGGADVRYCAEASLDVEADVSRPAWQVLCWMLERKGVQLRRNVVRHISKGKLQIRIPNPLRAALPFEERIGVTIRTDDPEFANNLKIGIQALGLSCVRTEMIPSVRELESDIFSIDAGPLATRQDTVNLPRLQILLADLLAAKGVDAMRYPLRTVMEPAWSTEGDVVITAPVKRALTGNMKAYDGPFPERFSIFIISDDVAASSHLQQRLQARGFVAFNTKLLEDADRLDGFRIRWGSAENLPVVAQAVIEEVTAVIATIPAPADMSIKSVADFATEDCDIWIYLPVKGVADGTWLTDAAAPSRFTVKLYSPEPDSWQPLLDELASWGFQLGEPEVEDVSHAQVRFGGAPTSLARRVAEAAQAMLGTKVIAREFFEQTDTDVWLLLPAAPVVASVVSMPSVDLQAWFRSTREPGCVAPRPFFDVQAERVRIGQTWLPRLPPPWHSFVPDTAAFSHYCIDQPTAETLEHLALSVVLREPCLLEGETSTSKTSSILFLASLIGQPVVRINLNGQTDTGELVGRYVPQHLSANLPLDLHEMQAGEHLLQPETRMILSRVEVEGRPLSGLEVQQIMTNEGMRTHPWRWQDGLVVQAMKKGWWVLLDEVNLAEPQILERMNSVLEFDPYMVLTEHDNSVVGAGGTPVHPGFRIFATMNPAEYAGRSVLSPAYRDRWRGYRLVPKPGEAEYRHMLRRLVFGEQPPLALQGIPYASAATPAPFALVADHAQTGDLLAALALFHSGLETATSAGPTGAPRIGARRKERHVFTRRGLLSVVSYIAQSMGDGTDPISGFREALLRYYMGRVGEEDRNVLIQLLDAAGIGPTTWRVGA